MSSRCKTLAGVVNVVDTCNKVRLAAMQVLCNAMGHGKKSNFQKKTLCRCAIQHYWRYERWVGVKFPGKSVA